MASVRRRPAGRAPLRRVDDGVQRQRTDELARGRRADRARAASTSRRSLRDADIETVLAELDRELVALAPVKTRIREIAALLVVDRLRRRPA